MCECCLWVETEEEDIATHLGHQGAKERGELGVVGCWAGRGHEGVDTDEVKGRGFVDCFHCVELDLLNHNCMGPSARV